MIQEKTINKIVLVSVIIAVALNLAALIYLEVSNHTNLILGKFFGYAMLLHAFFIAYLIHQNMSLAISQSRANIPFLSSIALPPFTPQNLGQYFRGIFLNIRQKMIIAFGSLMGMIFLLAVSVLAAAFLSGFVFFYIESHRVLVIPGIIYFIYIAAALLFYGLYSRQRLTQEPWNVVRAKYFGKMIVFAAMVVLLFVLLKI